VKNSLAPNWHGESRKVPEQLSGWHGRTGPGLRKSLLAILPGKRMVSGGRMGFRLIATTIEIYDRETGWEI